MVKPRPFRGEATCEEKIWLSLAPLGERCLAKQDGEGSFAKNKSTTTEKCPTAQKRNDTAGKETVVWFLTGACLALV